MKNIKILLLFLILFLSCGINEITLDPDLFGAWSIEINTNIIYFQFYPTSEVKIYNDERIYRWKTASNQIIIWYEGFWSKSGEIYLNYNIIKNITNNFIDSKTNYYTNIYLIINNVKYIKL